MYIRMIGGRDGGEVKDFSFDDAQALLKSGQAAPVNFNDADPLATRSMVEEVSALPFRVSPQTINTAVTASSDKPAPPTNPQKARKK
jgi:hypothetical protein